MIAVNLAIRLMIVALFFWLLILAFFSNYSFISIESCYLYFGLYFLLNAVDVCASGKLKGLTFVRVANDFFPVVDRVLHYGIVVLIFIGLYRYKQAYQVLFLCWIFGEFFILFSSKIVKSSSAIPYEIKLKKKLTGKINTIIIVSEKYAANFHWHSFLVCVYFLLPSSIFAIGLGIAFLLMPYIVKVALEGVKLCSYVFGSIENEIDAFVCEYDPEVIFYCSGSIGSVYQLNQWLPVLAKCDKRVMILVREKHYFNGVSETALPMAYAKGMSSIDKFLSASTRVVLYPANSAKNTHMMRWTHLKHVFVNHGESDKAVNVSKFLRCYDKVYVAGEMAVDRMGEADLDVSESRVALVGRPQTELLLSVNNKSISKSNTITILYAPTWEGFSEAVDYTSISDDAIRAFTVLLKENIVVIFKPHPLTGTVNSLLRKKLRKITELFQQAENAEVFGADQDIHELMNRSDIMVTDVSSVLNDYLYTEKSIIMTNPGGLGNDRYHELFYSSRGAYILRKNMSDLSVVIEGIKQNDDLRGQRKKIKEYSLGNWPQGTLVRFNEQLHQDYIMG